MSSVIVNNLSVSFTAFESNLNSSLFQTMIGAHGKQREFHALKNISMRLEDGDRVALLGKNGAGKTVLLKALSGLLPPSSGSIKINGEVMSAVDMSAGIVITATCMQNIVLRGLSFGLSRGKLKSFVQRAADFSELGDFLNSPVSSLSAGMRSRLVVSTFNALEPEILFMDEWIGVADKKVAEKQNGLLERLVDQTKIFVLASHRESLITAHCNKALVLESGKIAYSGNVIDSLSYLNGKF